MLRLRTISGVLLAVLLAGWGCRESENVRRRPVAPAPADTPARPPRPRVSTAGAPERAFGQTATPDTNCGGAVGWWYAASLEGLHQNMLRQLALYTGAPRADDALMAYYSNAFERNGASWELADGTPDLLVNHAGTLKVHEQTRDPHHRNTPEAAARAPDAFERRAWTRLQAGQSLVLDNTAYPTRAVGGIRAARPCLDCHDVPENTPLGAYSYLFREIADD